MVSETPATQELTVFAAASLAEAFQEMKTAFEESFPGARVAFNFAGTPTLRFQLQAGARADLFAAADRPQMALAVEARLVEGFPVAFARNRLVVIAPAQGSSVQEFADLSRPGLKFVLALPEVPAGAYAREALLRMESAPGLGLGFASRVLVNLVSLETSVRQVVAKVALGEADVGIVYATDVTETLAARVRVVPIPPPFNVQAEYPVAVVQGAAHPELSREFVRFLRSSQGQGVLRKHGFESPFEVVREG